MNDIKNIGDIQELLNKRVHFTSTCETFPINLVGKVLSIKLAPHQEMLMRVRVIPNNKIITIGTNMKNLKYQIVNS